MPMRRFNLYTLTGSLAGAVYAQTVETSPNLDPFDPITLTVFRSENGPGHTFVWSTALSWREE